MDNIVLSTRIRLARNLKRFNFVPNLSVDDANKITDKVIDSVMVSSGNSDSFFKKLEEEEISKNGGALIEKHLISPGFLNSSLPVSLILSNDEEISIMLNEEDHIRIQTIKEGYNPNEAFNLCNITDDLISEKCEYAFSKKYGYLTACPTNLGTGMRISFMVHIPAICMSGNLPDLKSNLESAGIVIRGCYGEGSTSFGNLYQISNELTLGLSENEILEKIKKVIEKIVIMEKELRNKILNDNVKNNIMRSLGIIKNSYLMDFNEFTNLWSNIMLGISLNIIKNIDITKFKKLIFELAPYSLNEKNLKDEKIKRAGILREL